MKLVKLSLHSRVGDIIQVDCGYGSMMDVRAVRVLSTPMEHGKMWPDSKRICAASVMILGTGEVFTTTEIIED